MDKKIELADQDVIETMRPLLRDFMRRVLGMDLSKCFVSDESSLSDFALSDVDEAGPDDGRSLEERVAAWDERILAKVEAEYGVRPASTADSLVVILAAIERHRAQRVQ